MPEQACLGTACLAISPVPWIEQPHLRTSHKLHHRRGHSRKPPIASLFQRICSRQAGSLRCRSNQKKERLLPKSLITTLKQLRSQQQAFNTWAFDLLFIPVMQRNSMPTPSNYSCIESYGPLFAGTSNSMESSWDVAADVRFDLTDFNHQLIR